MQMAHYSSPRSCASKSTSLDLCVSLRMKRIHKEDVRLCIRAEFHSCSFSCTDYFSGTVRYLASLPSAQCPVSEKLQAQARLPSLCQHKPFTCKLGALRTLGQGANPFSQSVDAPYDRVLLARSLVHILAHPAHLPPNVSHPLGPRPGCCPPHRMQLL